MFKRYADRRAGGARPNSGGMAAGLSERGLADLINVTRQQVHNYEAGANRITAARLYYITQALKVDIEGVL